MKQLSLGKVKRESGVGVEWSGVEVGDENGFGDEHFIFYDTILYHPIPLNVAERKLKLKNNNRNHNGSE